MGKKGEKTIFGIALLKKSDKVVGLRLLVTDFEKEVKTVNKSFKDLAGMELFNMAISKKGELSTIAREDITEKVIKGGKRSNKLDNYPVVDMDKKKIVKDTYVILCRTTQGKEEGFALADANGKVKYMTQKETVKLLNGDKDKIANGTIKSGDVVSAVVGYYKRVEKLGIISKVDKEWDLSDDRKTVAEHLTAINKNLNLKNKMTKETSIKAFMYLLQENDKQKVKAMKKMFDTQNTTKLAEFITSILEKYDNVFQYCENGDELKKGLARIMKGLLKDETYTDQVKQCMKNKSYKVSDYFQNKKK